MTGKKTGDILSTISRLKSLLHRWPELLTEIQGYLAGVERLRHANETAQREVEQAQAPTVNGPPGGGWVDCLRERLLAVGKGVEEANRQLEEFNEVVTEIQDKAEAVAAFAEGENISAGPLLMLADNLLLHPRHFEDAWEVIRRAEVKAALPRADGEDERDYMPAKNCRSDHITTHKQLKTLLAKEPGIRRRHNGQRLLVHAGDWDRWVEEQRRQTEVALSRVESAANDEIQKIGAEKIARKLPKK